ncbi:hypothetical protein Taro_036946 [Colocasia esculenta]|uniref:Uncharacterized protein n=1 Tax=Colocasia esculenta TaxID=4460 RepID=A0A843WN74_COLES|nr:hypothetical protein [Colocasia esculenta]
MTLRPLLSLSPTTPPLCSLPSRSSARLLRGAPDAGPQLQPALRPDPPEDRRGNQCCSVVVQTVTSLISTVWFVVRRFNNPKAYKHFVKSCHILVRDGSSVRTVREVRVVSGLPAATSMERLEVLDEAIHILSFRIVGEEHRLTNYPSITTLHGELHSSMESHFPMAEVLKCMKIGLICV